jgi:MFS family permease
MPQPPAAEAALEPRDGRAVAAVLMVLGHRAVRRLWLAGVGSGVVRWLEMLAFGLYALRETGSPMAVALMSLARLLPLLLFGALAGTLAEGVDRRRLLLWAYGAAMLVSGLLLAVALAGQLRLWHLAGAAFVCGVSWCVEVPVRRTALAEAGGVERIGATMGLEMLTTHATRMAGPALGGALFGRCDIEGVLALSVLLYGSGLVALAPLPLPRPPAGAHRRLAAELRQGLAFVRQQPLLAALVALTLVFNLCGLPYLALVPVIGQLDLGLDAAATGLLLALEGVGALIGTVLLMLFLRPAWFGPALGAATLAFFAAVTALGLAPGLGPAATLLFLAGFGMAGFSVMQATLPIAAAPPALRIRVGGVVMAAIGAAPFGFLAAGWLADRLGAPLTVTLMGAAGLAATGAACRRWPVLLRRHPVVGAPLMETAD